MAADNVTLLPGAESAPPREGAEETMRQFVTFDLGGETFAIALTDVQEIIRLPDLVPVPMSPPSLVGLANLRGAVLPVASLRRIFGLDDVDPDDASRVVVVNDGATVGFIVDRVARVISADLSEIDDPEDVSADIPPDMVAGMIRRNGKVVMVVSPRRLVETEFRRAPAAMRTAMGGTPVAGRAGTAGDGAAAADELQLVSFVVDGQEYALPVENVQEIVTLPSGISRVPNTPAEVIGVITLRERLLALVSLRSLFGLPRAASIEQSRIVVVSVPGPDGEDLSVGVVMDTVKEVLRVSRAAVEPVPPAVGRTVGEDIAGICRLSGGKRLVSIISAERLFGDVAASVGRGDGGEAVADPDDRATSGEENTVVELAKRAASRPAEADEEELFVVLKLAGGEYGVPIEAVQEIVRIPDELTVIPRTPSFVEGVVNLRGAVLPVVDKRTRLGLSRAPRNDRQRIMVLLLNGRLTGFIVDSVSEVLKVPKSRIRPAPELSAEQARLISRVANLEDDKRVILLVEVGRLLSDQESQAIARAA